MLEMKSLFVFTEVLFQGKKWHFLKKKHRRLCRLLRRKPRLTSWMEQLTPALKPLRRGSQHPGAAQLALR